jgi:hypothetical protein
MGNLQIAGGSSSGRVSQWGAAHEELTRLARRRAELDGLEGPALLRAFRAGVHRHLGLGSFAEYVERLFGYSRRTLDDKLRTAEALEALPSLARSLHEGTTTWSAVRELARVATAETELEWLAAARGRSVHEVERLVSGRRRGARPGDEPDAGQQRHVLRFDVSAETFATFREAMRALRQKSNESLDDDSALLLMAREVLGGPADERKSSYQIAVNICERCGRAELDARGEAIAVDAAVVEMARCDAQHIRRKATKSDPVGKNEAKGGAASEKKSTHVGENRANGEHAAAKQNDDAHDTGRSSEKTPVGPIIKSSETHVGARARATQSIPPALRRQVMRRDHGRCVVPGCRHATFVDLHHIEARSDGGEHADDNLIVLCSAHHRALHRGQLEIVSSVREGMLFRRADGLRYGSLDDVSAADACERAFLGLRGMGFGEKEARYAINHLRSERDTETLLRRALSLLTERRVRRE